MRRRRLIVLLLILAVLAGLVVLDEPGKHPVSLAIATALPPKEPTNQTRGARSPSDDAGAAPTLLTLHPRTPRNNSPADAFATRDWTPPPPSAPPPPPPPPLPPQAPPLPFQFLGKQSDGDQWLVFLGRQDRTYVIRMGDVIEGTYQVERIAPPLLTLTYLPLQQQQTLSIGTTQ